MNTLTPGSQIGRFTIKSFIATGGMGQVYLAADPQLQRDVALKILLPEYASDEYARRRFRREALSASQLSHPNICPIFDAAQADGIHYIVMPYLAGPSLKELLKQRLLTIEAALTYAIEIADALEAAHAQGLVHRDIKPSNVIINERGNAVVLDFGLAKQVHRPVAEEPSTLSDLTAGAIVGTDHYMSPEQISGDDLDVRSDLFSFAVLLYEMLTGERPFWGATRQATRMAILRSDPPRPGRLRPELPVELDAILKKCLQKEPAARYQSLGELKAELVKVLALIRRRPRHSPSQLLWRRVRAALLAVPRRQAAYASTVVIVLLLGVVSWLVWQSLPQKATSAAEDTLINPLNARSAKLFSWKSEAIEGLERCAFSPRGELLAFAAQQANHRQIWLKQTDWTLGGEALQVTKGAADHWSPIWSPDGQQLAFISNRDGKLGIWAVPILGGLPRLIGYIEGYHPQLRHWSADGSTLYYENASNLFAYNIGAGVAQQLTHFGAGRSWPNGFVLSPDGRRIAYSDQQDKQVDIWVSDLTGSQARRLTNDPAEDLHPRWSPDGQRIIYNSTTTRTAQIFEVFLDGRSIRQVTAGESNNWLAGIDQAGRILALTSRSDSDIWRLDARTAKEEAVTTELGMELWPQVTGDGRLVFQTAATWPILLNSSLKIKDSHGASSLPFGQGAFEPRWSRGTAQLAFLRLEHTQPYLWALLNGKEKRLTDRPIAFAGHSLLPNNWLCSRDFDWSPDDTQIAYCARNGASANLWSVSLADATERSLTNNTDPAQELFSPIWSPSGQSIAYLSLTEGPPPVRRVSLVRPPDQTARLIYESAQPLRLLGWSAPDKSLVIGLGENGPRAGAKPGSLEILQVSAAGGPAQRVVRLANAYLLSLELSPDGKTIALVARQDDCDNVWLISVPGGRARMVTANVDPKTYMGGLAWSPDSKLVYFSKQSNWHEISLRGNFD